MSNTNQQNEYLEKEILPLKYFTSTGKFFIFLIKKIPLIILQILITLLCAIKTCSGAIIMGEWSNAILKVLNGVVTPWAIYKVFIINMIVEVIGTILFALQNYYGNVVRKKVHITITNSLAAYIKNQDIKYKESLSSSMFNIYVSDLINKVTNTIDIFNAPLLLQLFNFFIAFGILFYYANFEIRILCTAFNALTFILIYYSNRVIQKRNPEALKKSNKVTNKIFQMFSNFEIVQIFYNFSYEIKELCNMTNESQNSSQKLNKIKAFLFLLVDFLFCIFRISINFIILVAIIAKNRPIGDSAIFGILLFLMFTAQKQIVPQLSIFQNFNSIKISLRNIFSKNFEESYEYTKKRKISQEKIPENYDIEFKNLLFQRNEGFALKIPNLKIKQGEHYAILGASGCGKTTLFKLLMQLYEIKDNMITIGNVNISEIQNKSLRKMVTLITQNNAILNDSILNNIRYSKLESTLNEVEEAAKKACVNNVIEKLPQSYDTILSPDDNSLSGGEKQRVCLARLFLSSAKILLLDETTSAIDPPTEVKLYENILNFAQNKTLLVIAHRLSVLSFLENVIFMKDGSILAIGKHKDLLEQYEEYRNFLNSDQFE